MKRILIIMVVAIAACSAVFAGDISIGVMQNYLNTNVVVDMELGRFGVEGAVGIPLVPGVFEMIDYYTGDKVDDDGNPKEAPNPVTTFLVPGAMVNGYLKVVDGKVFDLRLGLQGDAIGIVGDDGFSIVGLWGVSLGLDFKFNDKLGLNITGTLPAASIASAVNEDLGKYCAFYYTTREDENNADGLLVIPAAFNEFARISLKWIL